MPLLGKLEQKEHIIWDWNGTVIDDVDLCFSIFVDELKSFNL